LDLVTVAPVPVVRVLTVSWVLASVAGKFTLGVVPYAPVTETFALLFVLVVAQLAAAALVELAFAELEAVGSVDLDELQPAKVAPASKGMAMTARKRRMKSSKWSMSASPAYLQSWPRGPP
jgi:hypothetical protein